MSAVADPNTARSRRNLRLALMHGLLALAFLAAFVWSQVHG